MKMQVLIVLLVFTYLLVGCTSRDDDFNNMVRLHIENAVEFENKNNYIVGDTIFFELNFSRYLKEDGYSNLLDIYETTGAEEFHYSFALNKFSDFSNSYTRVYIDPELIFDQKGTTFDQYSGATAVLNQEKNLYESKIGLILAEAGKFELDFDFLYLNNRYELDKISVEIQHVFTENDPIDLEFTVTE